MNRRITATAAACALAIPLGVAAAAPASATTVAHLNVICSAVNIRTSPTTAATALGVGYKGDPDAVTKGLLPKGATAFTWLYGAVTRASDHKKITGWAIASCIH
ncbi:hypothetical protein [Streptacidiphilus sp. EB103A]|uniref:hypothetical protein n=1 Tax=Streptacidiphilus sp. EB103A TaxID=3156275 RepID=UPI0035143E05